MKDIGNYLTIINHWTEQYQSLHDILDAEQNALEKRDFALLESLVSQKNNLVQQINLEQIPSQFQQTETNQVDIKQVKQHSLSNSEIKPHWDNLMTLVNQCHYKNEVNSRLIELVTNSTKRTFNLIKGFDPDNNIYDAKGDSKIVKHYGQPVSA